MLCYAIFWWFQLHKKDIRKELKICLRTHCPWVTKFWIYLSFVRLLPNRDLPDLTCEFFNKEGLYLALSAAKPMLFERYKYLVSSHWAFNCEIPDKRRYLQKMNWFLPYKCLFCQPYFFYCISWIFFAKGIVDSVVEAEHLFKKIWDNNNSQAREKLNISWRKSGKFKISYLNDNVSITNYAIQSC